LVSDVNNKSTSRPFPALVSPSQDTQLLVLNKTDLAPQAETDPEAAGEGGTIDLVHVSAASATKTTPASSTPKCPNRSATGSRGSWSVERWIVLISAASCGVNFRVARYRATGWSRI
jgi:hypothetical protein